MENEIEVFSSGEFGSIRILQQGGRSLFCGADVAKALGYAIPTKAVNTHCKGVSKMEAPTGGGVQQLLFIPEGDVYRLIAHSKLPAAERFESWVFDEVLPCIRSHGMYASYETLHRLRDDPALGRLLASDILAEREKSRRLEDTVAALAPKAAYYDAFMRADACTSLRETAKELQIPEKRFCRFLTEAGFLYRSPGGNLLPYAGGRNAGLFRVRDFCAGGRAGCYTLVTPKGKALFRLLTADGEENETDMEDRT